MSKYSKGFDQELDLNKKPNKSVRLELAKALNYDLIVLSDWHIKYHILESLILAQDERWRRA